MTVLLFHTAKQGDKIFIPLLINGLHLKQQCTLNRTNILFYHIIFYSWEKINEFYPFFVLLITFSRVNSSRSFSSSAFPMLVTRF